MAFSGIFRSPFSSAFCDTESAFSFADVPGLIFDFDPLLGMYTDTARTTPVASDSDVVAGVLDQSANAYTGEQATGANQPAWRTNIANSKPAVRFATNDYLAFAGLAARTDTQGAVYAVFRRNADSATGQTVIGSGDQGSSSRFFWLDVRPDTGRFLLSALQQNNDTLDWLKGSTHINLNKTHIGTWKSSGIAYSLQLDGALEASVVANGSNNGDWLGDTSLRDNFTIGTLWIGASPSFFANLDIVRLLYYSPVPSASDEAAILAELGSLYGRSVVTQQVVCDGDSLTAGVGAETPYPSQLETLLGSGWRTINMGVSGQTIVNMQSDASTQINPQRNTNLAKNILCAWGGTNDLLASVPVATVQTNYQAYCAARQAAGFQVVAFTVLPRSAGGTPAGFEADRQTFNTWLRANWATFADALADVAADNRIGDAGDELDTTYYQVDKVHLNTTGHGVVAGIVQTAINGLP